MGNFRKEDAGKSESDFRWIHSIDWFIIVFPIKVAILRHTHIPYDLFTSPWISKKTNFEWFFDLTNVCRKRNPQTDRHRNSSLLLVGFSFSIFLGLNVCLSPLKNPILWYLYYPILSKKYRILYHIISPYYFTIYH